MAENNKIDIKALKDAFKEGATPNEQDYGNLITLASVGSKALGATDGDATTPHPGAGLEIVGGKLTVLADKSYGVSVGENGIEVKVDDKTLSVTKESGLALKLQKNGGLEVSKEVNKNDGLHIKTGPGLKAGDSGLFVDIDTQRGLTTVNNKLAVAVNTDASGLTFDKTTGALKVNVSTSSDNYITADAQGLAITAAGIEKIKAMLEAESTGALANAVKNTDSGAHNDTTSSGNVETAIAKALNTAHGRGYEKRQKENQLTVTPVPDVQLDAGATTGTTVPINKYVTAPALTNPVFYFMPVEKDGADWKKLVGVEGVSADGVLHLSTQSVATGSVKVLVLAVSHATGQGLDIAAAEVTVNVKVRPVVTNVKVSPAGPQVIIGAALGVAYDFVPEGDDGSTYQWYRRKSNTSEEWAKPASGGRDKSWTPDSSYVGYDVRVGVTPKSKSQSSVTGTEVFSNEISFVPVPAPAPIKHIAVNGHVFENNVGFPTTAFRKAAFTLVLTSGQASDYTWNSNADSAVSVSATDAGAVVMFESKPKSASVVITGTSSLGQSIEYRFTLKHWFTNHGSTTMTWADANLACQNGN